MESTELLATPQQLHVQPTQRITREMTNANEVQTRKETTRTTRGMANADENTKQQVYTEYNDATGIKIKVTDDKTARIIDMPTKDSEVGGLFIFNDNINHIWLNEVGVQTKNDGIADEDDIDFYVMHACIQSDPGEPMKWKDTLYGH